MILKLHYDYTNVYKYTNDYTVYIFENPARTSKRILLVTKPRGRLVTSKKF